VDHAACGVPDVGVEGIAAQFKLASRNWSAVFALLLALGYVTKTSEAFSRVWATTWFIGTLVGLGAIRVVAQLQIEQWRRCGKLARKLAIIDVGGCGDALAHRVLHTNDVDAHLLGVFPARSIQDKGLDDLTRLSRLHRVDEIIVAAMSGDEVEIATIVRKLSAIPANVHVCTSLLHRAFPQQEPTLLFGNPVLTIYRQPFAAWGRLVKRAEDLALSAPLLLLLALLMLGIAAAIWLDSPGPILFRQKRQGFNNSVFEILKFRTMTHVPGPELEVPQARRDDPRVTRRPNSAAHKSRRAPATVERADRQHVVGRPPPHAITHHDHYSNLIGGYLGRHRVQPGITGWAQVNGHRGETDTLEKMRRRVDYDLAYIEQWSLLFDLRILGMTALGCIFCQNAY
jgi:putative colanic acid biosynthesis UDP-glucose lipid carrier transferase